MIVYLAGGGGQMPKFYETVKNMNIFIAGTNRIESDFKKKQCTYTLQKLEAFGGGYIKADNLFQNVNILQSFYYCNDFTEKVILPNCKRFLLDSGAFTFMNNAKSVDWNEYVNAYANYINKNKIKRYFELDIDSIIGFENVLKIRERLESLTGIKPIPVWHKSRGIEQFKSDCMNYPYVAIGGIVTGEIKKTEHKLFPSFISIAHKYGAKIHGLGYTNLKGLTQYHFDSVDSTAWVSGNRFGAVYRFDGKTMQKFNKPNGMKVKNIETALNNFEEWKKFSKYAERKL